MGSAAIISHDMALRTDLEHMTFTHTRVGAHALTKALAPEWDALLADWFTVDKQELLLFIDILRAAARIIAADDQLDLLTDMLSSALLMLTGKDRKAQLYVFYFRGKTPTELKRPILGRQLGLCKKWVESLKASPHATLQALGALFEQAVDEAEKAVKALDAAKQANHTFRNIGERKEFVDRFNALRKSTHGRLAEMPHKHPEANLPGNFADRFFKSVNHQSSSSIADMTSIDLVALIADKEDELAELQKRLQEVLAREEVEAKKSEERSAIEEELAKELEEIQARQARVAELQKKLKK